MFDLKEKEKCPICGEAFDLTDMSEEGIKKILSHMQKDKPHLKQFERANMLTIQHIGKQMGVCHESMERNFRIKKPKLDV